MDFDAVLLLSFGGPEGPEQVRPFLENVTRGRNVPPERLDDVAQHYLHFGGVSPINGINRDLVAQLQAVLDVPVYFGNRNWDPYVEDAVATMCDNGIRRAAVFTTSAWSGYSGCTQYSEDLDRARRAAGPGAPELIKLRRYFDHPLFVEIFADNIATAARHSAERRAAGLHRALGTGGRRRPARPQVVQPPSALCRKACRGGCGLRRLRPGLAVALGPAAGAVAGARRRRPCCRARRGGHQVRHRLPDRFRRRPHRGGVGSRHRVA